ncbi:MAG: iron ABC transporter permease [Microscillaceae bacterium]|nr:iron ABC transporter permease [Microscillaceae bacterium]
MKSLIFLLSFLILILFFIINIFLGSVHIPILNIIQILWQPEPENQTWVNILYKIRIPRAFTAILAGVALSLSGLQMQTLFRNPLAGPSVLGISSGASMGVALVVLGSGSWLGQGSFGLLWVGGEWLIISAAFVGAAAVMGIILLVSFRVRDNVVLLIVGMMVGAFASALVGIWQYFSHPESLQNYVIWTFGSLAGVTARQLEILVPVVILGIVASFSLIKILNVLLLGENYARSSGLNILRSRLYIITISALLTGSVTAFCGPISFVGIAVPHLARGLFKTSDHSVLIPACALLGSIFMLFCDVLSKLPYSSAGLPINIMTSLIGAPLVILIIMRNKNLKTAF